MPILFDILTQAVLPFAWIPVTVAVCALVFLVIRSKGRKIKGWVGEKAVRSILSAHGHENLHDLYLPIGKGVTQVDHVALVGSTLVVIETKNYEGAIFPQHGTIAWTQALAGGKVKNRFQSPLQQNQGHARAVRALVGPGVPIEGLVVFAGGATFPKGRPEGVLTIAELPRELKRLAALPGAKGDHAVAWDKLKAAHEAADRAAAKKAHEETVAKAQARDERRKAA